MKNYSFITNLPYPYIFRWAGSLWSESALHRQGTEGGLTKLRAIHTRTLVCTYNCVVSLLLLLSTKNVSLHNREYVSMKCVYQIVQGSCLISILLKITFVSLVFLPIAIDEVKKYYWYIEEGIVKEKTECYAKDKIKSPIILRQFLVIFQQLTLYLSQN